MRECAPTSCTPTAQDTSSCCSTRTTSSRTAPDEPPEAVPFTPVSGASLGLDRVSIDEIEASTDPLAFEHPQHTRYTGGGLIGRGGMGEIRSAHDLRLGRTVAIKTPVGRDRVAVRQLVAEATLTARLVHPGIVAIHDAGCSPDGRPYYTMPVVHGRSLAEAIAESTPAERLRLVRHFLDACEAIAYAHGRGVLHRDLKPGNILVGRFGETVVVDWGLAGPTAERPQGIIGTPRYMSPEQSRGEALTPAADVYALGATLREILTGSPQGRPGSGTPPELLAIVDRATQDSASARYADGTELAEDVAAWFEGRRVTAHRYRLRELVARAWATHRVPLAIGLLAVLGISLAIAIGYRRTAIERALARDSERSALVARAHAEDNLAQAEVAQALGAIARGSWPQAELLAAGALVHNASPQARGVLARFDPITRPRLIRRDPMPHCSRLAVSITGDHIACASKGEIRVSAAGLPWDAMTSVDVVGDPIAVLESGTGIVVDHSTRGLRFVDLMHPDHPIALYGAMSASKRILPNDSGGLSWIAGTTEQWSDHRGYPSDTTTWCEDLGRSVSGVVGLRADGLRVAICQNGEVYMSRDRSSSEAKLLVRLSPALGGPLVFAFAGSGSSYAAVGMAGGSVVVFDLDEGRIIRTFASDNGTPYDLALTPSRLALSDGRDSVFVWEISNGALLVRLASKGARVRWLDKGRRLRVIGSHVEEWELSPTRTRPHVQATGNGIAALSLSPDGDHVLTAHGDGHVRLGRLDQSDPIAEMPLHFSVVKDVEFSPDGMHAVVVCAQDPRLLVIDMNDVLHIREFSATLGRRVAWLEGEAMFLATYRGGLDTWRAGVATPGPLSEHESRIVDMESDWNRHALSFLDADGKIFRIGADPGVAPQLIAQRPGASSVVGNDELVIVVDDDTTLDILTLEGEIRSLTLPVSRVTEMAISPDGTHLALGHNDGDVWLWSLSSLEPIAVLRGHIGRVSAMAFDAEGQWLVTGSWDGDLRQWSMRSLEVEPEALLSEAERAWGVRLEELLEANSGADESPR